MRKKILMICSIWHEDYMRALMKGIQRSIAQEDVEVHMMAAYDASGNVQIHEKGHEIFSLPVLQEYSGVLCAASSVGNTPIVEQLVEACNNYRRPILSIDRIIKDVPSIGIDNYQAVFELVEHMITVHGCKVLNYLGGAETHAENKERFRAFCDCLKKHGIVPDEERIMHYNFLHSDGRNAYHVWKEKGKHIPDVLICANDNMAIGYCEEAAKDGYYVPDDFLISGFDNFEEGKYFCPSITSVNRDWESLGYVSMNHLLTLIEGEKVQNCRLYSQGKIVLNESCGCALDRRNIRENLKHMFLERRLEEALEEKQRNVRQRLCSCNNITELQKKFGQSFTELDINSFVLCLKEGIFAKNNSENVRLISAQRQKNSPNSMDLVIKELDAEKKEKIYIFSALYFGNLSYGYSVATYQNNFMKNNLHRTLLETISLALENIRQKEEIHMMNEQLKELYLQDSLTGLYNRFGYAQMGEEFFLAHQKRVSLVYVDVDNLKVINDSFGHAMGDVAIKGVAISIAKVFGPESVKVRMGGDEFLIICELQDEQEILQKEERVSEVLLEYKKGENLSFPLEASMGHIHSDGMESTLESLVKMADSKMYDIKQKKKMGKR